MPRINRRNAIIALGTAVAAGFGYSALSNFMPPSLEIREQ
jgi:hypothetical protein